LVFFTIIAILCRVGECRGTVPTQSHDIGYILCWRRRAVWASVHIRGAEEARRRGKIDVVEHAAHELDEIWKHVRHRRDGELGVHRTKK
jgi:hypothetical protein